MRLNLDLLRLQLRQHIQLQRSQTRELYGLLEFQESHTSYPATLSASGLMAPPTGATAYLINHVALPPDLPQTDDQEDTYDGKLLQVVIQALHDLESQVVDGQDKTVALAIATMKSLASNRDSRGELNPIELGINLDRLIKDTVGGIVPLEFKIQNAGLLIRRDGPNIIFESFELSPTNEASSSCKGRLRRTFPGTASQIPVTQMQDSNLTQALVSALLKMSTQTATDLQPQKRSDTSHPGLVTEYLMNVIAAIGEPVDATRIIKHTRDEVLSKSGTVPWRRSPLWLFIRVMLQLVFNRGACRLLNPDELYKAFIILLLSRILALAKEDWDTVGLDSLRALSAKLIRRIYKFKDIGQAGRLLPDWQKQVRENLIDVHDTLDANWKEAVRCSKANIDSVSLLTLCPDKHLDTPLWKLDAFLAQASASTLSTPSHDFKPTFGYPVFPTDEVPKGFVKGNENQVYRLAAVEAWVETSMQTWVESHSDDPSSCSELFRLMKEYHRSATIVYAGVPASMSIMYLTLCDIWVQCDILACRECPLLQKYDPEVQLNELQCLSSPLKAQMQRLHNIESRVESRRKTATKTYPSVFCSFGTSLSFAVKYFESEQGLSLQMLLAEVERDAEEKRQNKCKELDKLKGQFQDLMEQQ